MDALERIIDLLEQRGWTFNFLAKKADIPQSTLSALYRRRNVPTLSTLGKICDAFEITVAEFLP